jgi:hypothetical protein
VNGRVVSLVITGLQRPNYLAERATCPGVISDVVVRLSDRGASTVLESTTKMKISVCTGLVVALRRSRVGGEVDAVFARMKKDLEQGAIPL